MAANPQTVELLAGAAEPRSGWTASVAKFVRQRPLGAIGAAVVLLNLVVAVLAKIGRAHV